MRRPAAGLFATVTLVGLIGASAGCGAADEALVVVVAPEGTTAQSEPCRTGCAAVTPDEHETLGDEEVLRLLGEVAQARVGADVLATETLLFNGAETKAYLVRKGADPLPVAHAAWLRHELERDQVEVGFRLLSEDGTLLAHRNDTVSLVDKHHLLLRDTGALGRIDVNGKVKRVGVKHLWARF